MIGLRWDGCERVEYAAGEIREIGIYGGRADIPSRRDCAVDISVPSIFGPLYNGIDVVSTILDPGDIGTVARTLRGECSATRRWDPHSFSSSMSPQCSSTLQVDPPIVDNNAPTDVEPFQICHNRGHAHRLHVSFRLLMYSCGR